MTRLFIRWKKRYMTEVMKEAASEKVIKFLRRRNVEEAF